MTLKINNPVDASNVMMPDGTSVEVALSKKQDSLAKSTFKGDFDATRVGGWYWCDFANCTNAPYSNGYGWMNVVQASKSALTCTQIIYRFNGNTGIPEIAVRPYTNSRWYPWRKIETTAI